MGDKKADLVLKNCSLVSVYTNEIIPKTQISVIGDRIAYVGPDASHTISAKTAIIDINEKYVSPSFADPHIHIDQFVLPLNLQQNAFFVESHLFFQILLISLVLLDTKDSKNFLI